MRIRALAAPFKHTGKRIHSNTLTHIYNLQSCTMSAAHSKALRPLHASALKTGNTVYPTVHWHQGKWSSSLRISHAFTLSHSTDLTAANECFIRLHFSSTQSNTIHVVKYLVPCSMHYNIIYVLKHLQRYAIQTINFDWCLWWRMVWICRVCLYIWTPADWAPDWHATPLGANMHTVQGCCGELPGHC